MKRLVVGGSISGIYLCLLLRHKFPLDEIILIEKEKKLARKIYATGNGHCNILAKSFHINSYNNPEFISRCLAKYPFEVLSKTLESFGVFINEVKGGIYPLSYSASTTVSLLESALNKAKVKVYLNEKVVDYKLVGDKKVVLTEKNSYEGDYLYFATGGCSSPKLGSDGSIFKILKEHGYKIEELKPGLCPIYVKEKLDKLDGVRHAALVKVVKGKEVLYQEEGELLFRKNGLSGICIFNLESYILRHNIKECNIVVDFFPEVDNLDMQDKLFEGRKIIGKPFLYSFFERPLADYLIAKSGFNYDRPDKEDFIDLAYLIKNLRFTFNGVEGFNNSQVSIGGVSLDNLNEKLYSKHEKDVGFVGEILDIDGFCGGYNLTWALLSALIITE